MQNKVSVIIPIYNVEDYLEKCLESITNQTYKNLEIICVNDCSPDGSDKILKQYSKKDNRIKIINRKENGGLSAARNTGLNHITGEYVYFFDSDDWIDLDYIEKMVNIIEKTNADIAANTNIARETSSSSKQMEGKKFNKNINSFLKGNIAVNNLPWSVWSHIYKKDFIINNNLKFKEGCIQEDVLFQHMAKFNTDKIFAFYGPAYHYTVRAKSITLSRKSVIAPHIKIWKLIKDFYLKHICQDELNIKIFEPEIFLQINDENDFNISKEHILSIQDYTEKKKHLFSDYELFILNSVKNSKTFNEFKNKIGKNPYLTYITRYKLHRQKEIKISAIIPVYKSEPYIERCLDSICGQTFDNIEIICINDCSPDNSIEILKEYARFDNRIKIIDFKENKGVSAARNAGLKIANGEYIAFVDPDDYLDLDFYEKLYNIALETNTDIVKGNRKTKGFDGKTTIDLLNAEIHKQNNNKFSFAHQFTTAIYKTSLIKENDIIFPEDTCHSEDIVFLLWVLLKAKSFKITDDTFYNYIRHKNSLNPNLMDNKIITSFLSSTEKLCSILNTAHLNEISKEDYALVYSRYLSTILDNFFKCTNDEDKKLCCEKIILLYKACLEPQSVDKHLALISYFMEFIKKEDSDILFNELVKCKSLKHMTVFCLRKNIERNMQYA